MDNFNRETWRMLLIVFAVPIAWGLATLVIVLGIPSSSLTVIGLGLLNLAILRLAWRDRTIFAHRDRGWPDVLLPHCASHLEPARQHSRSLPRTRPLALTPGPARPTTDGRIAIAWQTFVYDN